MKQFLIGLATSAIMLGSSLFADEESDLLLQQRIQAHITFLADDLLRGRQPGTDGYDIAAAYVASQFRQMGLAPGGTEGSYFQPVPIRRAWLVPGTAEEKGLVGSEYFAHNPVVPTASMAGVINLDMPVLLYDFGDVIAFGAEHSTMRAAVQTAAIEAGLALTPDPFPEQNIFVRSDHYRFVQQGVPAIFLVIGSTSLDGKTDTAPRVE